MSEESLEQDNTDLTSLTDTEIQASEKGWVPQEDWDGDSDQWRPAKEFLDRGELMDRISSQSRQLGQFTSEVDVLKQSLQQLGDHNKKIAEQEYTKAIKHLKEQKADALQYGEYDKAVDIDEQMSDLKESKKEIEVAEQVVEQPQEVSQEPAPEIVAWMAKNTWYDTDIVLQGAADAIARQYLGKNPAAEGNPSEVLEYVTKQITKEFPDRFSNKRKPSATVDSANGKTVSKGKKSKHTIHDLTDEQRKFAKTFANSGVMTEQEYVDQLSDIGEIN